MTLGILVEPMLILSLLVLALIAGSTHIEMISNTLATGWNSPLTTVLALLACGFACFIEMGKIPFDVAEAEQELQEGPLTEYSGAGLALAKWGLGLKQVVMAALTEYGKSCSDDVIAAFYRRTGRFVFATTSGRRMGFCSPR